MSRASSSSPFLVTAASGQDVSVFDNGLPIGRNEWISQGRLSRLQYHRAARGALWRRGGELRQQPDARASRRHQQSRGSREPHRARVAPPCLWYIREVDPATLLLTGLTRDGVYLVEHGEIVGSVNNFRFDESPVDLLSRRRSRRDRRGALLTGVERMAEPHVDAAPWVAEFNMSR